MLCGKQCKHVTCQLPHAAGRSHGAPQADAMGGKRGYA
jgi:hypothetical protein